MKLVSFILPAFKAKFLAQAIQSILDQTYRNFELVVVDDASPEGLREIVSTFDDPRITYYRNEHNIGGTNLVQQWNHCLQYATGEYMVLAADDDLYDPTYLNTCMVLAEKYPEVDLIRTGAEQIDEGNNLIGIDGMLPELCSKYWYVYAWLHATVFTCIGNYMFKTEVIKEKQFIDFPFAFGSDTATTISMANHGVANTPDMLFRFRISSIHLSSNKGRLQEKLVANTMLFKWLKNLDYAKPTNARDLLFYNQTQWNYLYTKCKYDYYNLVIKYLPLSKIGTIQKCELLSTKDKILMGLRYLIKRK